MNAINEMGQSRNITVANTSMITTSTKLLPAFIGINEEFGVARLSFEEDHDPRRRARAACDIDKSSGCLRLADFIGRLIDGVLSL